MRVILRILSGFLLTVLLLWGTAGRVSAQCRGGRCGGQPAYQFAPVVNAYQGCPCQSCPVGGNCGAACPCATVPKQCTAEALATCPAKDGKRLVSFYGRDGAWHYDAWVTDAEFKTFKPGVSVGCAGGACTTGGCTATTDDALDVVNAMRAQRGLRPYRRCPLLSAAAEACARFRAGRRIHGHVPGGMNDFQFVPAGCRCKATGAEGPGWNASWGFGTCAMFDTDVTEAGAAWVTLPSGDRYCSLFVR